jgi:hypothetical protein
VKEITRGFEIEIVLIFVLVTTFVVSYSFSFSFGQANSSPPLISTRGHYDLKTGQLLQGHNPTDYKATIPFHIYS